MSPVELESCLIFHVNQFNQDFVIRLKGELPLLSARTDAQVIFPEPTAVCEENVVRVPLTNDGEVPFLFAFDDPVEKSPFTVSPNNGLIEPKETLMLTYKFAPIESGQIQDKFKFHIKKTSLDAMAKVDHVNYEVALSAIAKFPFFRIKIDDVYNDVLEFDETCIISQS